MDSRGAARMIPYDGGYGAVRVAASALAVGDVTWLDAGATSGGLQGVQGLGRVAGCSVLLATAVP